MFDAPSASRPPPPLGQKFVLASPDLSPPGGSHARHDDEFPFDAPDHPGAFRENLSPRRNCVVQAGQLHCSHLLRGLLSSRPPSWRGPQQTRPRTWRPRSFHDVESCEPPGSLLRSSLRRRHPASAEPAPSSDRKSTRLNSSHLVTSYAVFCLKKKINSPRT